MFNAIAYINTPRWQTSRLGLERTYALLELLHNPQQHLKFIHVAGTNGKGSTCAYLATVLHQCGYQTGLFTSPYIEHFEERIRVNGQNISGEDLSRVTLQVKAAADQLEAQTGDHPTEFELMTAVALLHFAQQGCDIVVLEVGLGGRLDSTNVITHPEVSVICRLGLDHTALLGNTLAEVAAEKAGIIKPGCPVVSYPQEPEAAAVLEHVAAEQGAPLAFADFTQLQLGGLVAGEDTTNVSVIPAAAPNSASVVESAPQSTAGTAPCANGSRATTTRATTNRAAGNPAAGTLMQRFTYRGTDFATRLLASYQPGNAAVALEVLQALRSRGWFIPPSAVERGIALTQWPGRFELLPTRPLSIVDGGHNPQGAQALADTLETALPVLRQAGAAGPVVFLVGLLADKDYPAMLRTVAPFAQAVVATQPNNPRALAAPDLTEALREAIAASQAIANTQALDAAHTTSNNPSPDAPVRGLQPPTGVPIETQPDPADAVAAALRFAGEDGLVVAFGSLYQVGQIKQLLLKYAGTASPWSATSIRHGGSAASRGPAASIRHGGSAASRGPAASPRRSGNTASRGPTASPCHGESACSRGAANQ